MLRLVSYTTKNHLPGEWYHPQQTKFSHKKMLHQLLDGAVVCMYLGQGVAVLGGVVLLSRYVTGGVGFNNLVLAV